MANDLNRVLLIGRLTRDPELKSTNSGSYFCRFTLASNRSIYNRQSGESRDEAGFFDCVAWGKTAEIISKYVQKGRRLGVDGSLRFSSWEGTDGQKRSKVEIFVEGFQFLDTKNAAPTESFNQTEPGSTPMASLANESANPYEGGSDIMSDDEIPF